MPDEIRIGVTLIFEPAGEGICVMCDNWSTRVSTVTFVVGQHAATMVKPGSEYPAEVCPACAEEVRKGLREAAKRHGDG